jgi:outer membrane protein
MNFHTNLKKMLLMAFLGLAAALGAFADAFNLEQIRELALANSKSLAKYNIASRTAVLDEKSQTYTFMPSLSLGASASASLWETKSFEAGGGLESNIKDSVSAGMSFGVSQKLYDGGKNGILRSINAISSEITKRDALTEYYAVIAAADAAYFNVLQAAAAMEAADSALAAAKLTLSVAEVRLSAGMISYGDYLQVLAEKESKETSRNQAKRDVALNQAKIKSLTALSEAPSLEEIDFEAQERLIQKLAFLNDDEIDELYAYVLSNAAAQNPSLAKSALQNQIAEKNVSLAKRDYAPSLSASIGTGLNYGVSNGFSLSSGRVSISGSIPLDFWVTANNVEKKKLALQDASINYQTTEASMELDLQTAFLDLITQAASVLSSRRAYDYSKQHYEQVRELFNLSQGSVSSLSDAAALETSSHNQLIKAQYGFLSGLSTLKSLGFSGDL